MLKTEFILFIGEWEKIGGVKILEHYPKNIFEIDLEHLAWKIFFFYENFYLSENSEKYKRTFFQLPIKEKGKNARILIDSYPSIKNEDQSKPYLIAILLPDYFPQNQMEEFDEELKLLNQKFRKEETLQLNEYIEKIYSKFNLKQRLQDSEISLDEEYTKEEAIRDFKRGLQLFSENAYKISYMIIKKSYLKFKKDNNIKLLLEATYFISTIFSKLKKYKTALDYYIELRALAEKLKHQKYLEKSIFMAAFCAYKTKQYSLAIEFFEETIALDLQFIDYLDIYLLYGKTLRLVGKYDKSIQILTEGINWIDMINLNIERKKKLAHIYLELAHSYFFITTEEKVKKQFHNDTDFNFQKIIKFYRKANKIFYEFNDYNNLIICNQIIGTIYDKINKRSKAITYYRRAIEYTEQNNDVLSRMRLYDLIINDLIMLDKKMEAVKEIDEILYKMKTYAFLNLPIIAQYHVQLGKVYDELNQTKEALSEFLIALNIYEKFKEPREENLELLNNIIKIYSKTEELKYLDYYRDKRYELRQKLNKIEKKQPEKSFSDIIKDLWILTKEGKILFSHTPASKSDPQLLSGFLSATLNFSFEMAYEQLKAIKLGIDQFFLYGETDSSYIVVGRVSINETERRVREMLGIIYSEFNTTYGSSIEKDNYTQESFDKFIKFLNKI
ncbi:MAG: tetratricopeptide repeat protein [Promethearchaeota archaeon]|nr:MAG: tetratricopeptide repeat protein [Candidatus Lokiarchaeota archaeon]